MASLCSSPAVSLHNAVALSGRFPLLAGADLCVASGETVLVEGPNGAGKTSLLRVCAALVPLASGSASVLGMDPSKRRIEVRRRVGLLSHASHLYDDLTVRENVRFAVRAAGGDPSRIEASLDRWGLVGRLVRTTASKLSAGQQRRVALAALCARWPELWLLDEPHAGLDVGARRVLDEMIGEAQASGVTVVIASHETDASEYLASRAVVVQGGRVVSTRPVGFETAAGAIPMDDGAALPAPVEGMAAHPAPVEEATHPAPVEGVAHVA